MVNKNELALCFEDTRNKSTEDKRLSVFTKEAANSTKIYHEGFFCGHKSQENNAEIIVEEGTSFAAAKKYLPRGRVAVLNFANPENPGGGVQNGAMAQEECLCRSSNLFECISSPGVFEDYYNYHRKLGSSFYSDRIIYSRNITVFKTDDVVPVEMPQEKWFQVDVITCAAPYLAKRRYTNKRALLELFKSRIKNIFEAAIENEVDVLILGAFGCGAFRNPPDIVAKVFHDVINENEYDAKFAAIVFAIKRTEGSDAFNPCPNIMAFEDEFIGLSEERNKLRFYDTACAESLGEMKMPSGVVLKAAKEYDAYISWQHNNKYYGKQFSILGDSISTLAGYNPRGYNVFFKDENCEKSGVRDMPDTWWGKVIDFFGGELLVNNSWSGSRVTRLPDRDDDFPSGISDVRTNGLHINSVKPDVIIVYLGTNDWANGVNLNNIDYHGDELTPPWHSFENSYSIMLKKISENYPGAEIFCCTLNTTFMSSKPSFSFPFSHGGTHIEAYNEIIRTTCTQFGCKLIDLYEYHLPYDAVDGSHPTAGGMNTLATMVIRSVADDEGSCFLDCNDNDHDYIISEEYTGGTQYICRKCGKIKHKGTSYPTERKETASDNTDIIDLNPDCTTMLYSDDGEIRLFQISTGKEKIIQKKSISAGRDPGCDLHLEGKYIARQQAVFIFDGRNWMLTDCRSTNGTWLNDTKLIPDKKYVLHPDDKIDFAHSEELVFYKTQEALQNEEMEAERGRIILESAIKVFSDSNHSDVTAFKLILAALSKTPLYIPVIMDVDAFLDGADPTKLKPGDVINSSQNVGMNFQRITVSETELIPMFTSKEEVAKGPATSALHMYPQDYLNSIAKTDTDVVVNPFGGNAFFLNQKTIQEILIPLVDEKTQSAKKTGYQSEANLLSGKIVDGKYVLDNVIGHGGATTVYQGHDRIGKKYAVKVIDESVASSKSIVDSVCNEAMLLSRMNHPAIRKTIDICKETPHIFLVFEYIDGINLEQMMQENNGQPLSAELIVSYAKQIASALAYIHSLTPPIINRDIKPRNIMVDRQGIVKLVDFDIAIEFAPKRMDETCLGTKGYAPPEQYEGKSEPRSDIYALGMTMYYLSTGQQPNDPSFVQRPVCETNPAFPKGLDYIIKKCTETNPNLRYQSCEELLSDLENYHKIPKKKGILKSVFGNK